MKKLACTILSGVLLLGSPAFGQIGEPRNDLAIGFNGGYTLNQISFQPSIQQEMKGAVTFGFTARYTCEKYFKSLCAVQAEVNYANLGWKEKIETSTDTYSRDIYYIQVPVLARMGWGYERRGAMFYVVAGPQFGFFLDEKGHKGGQFDETTLPLRPGGINEQYDMPLKNKFEYGITAGAGIEVNTGIGHFLVEGRYYYGLSDIFSNGKQDTFGRSANGTIAVRATYLFDIIKTKGLPDRKKKPKKNKNKTESAESV